MAIDLSASASALKASLQAREEMMKPHAWNILCTNNTKHVMLFDLYHKETPLDGDDLSNLHESHTQTLCELNPKMNANSWSYDHTKNRIYLSRDIWEKKDPEEFQYQMHGALAAVIAYKLFGSTDRSFYWKLCFYALGFNPQRDTEERKKLNSFTEAQINEHGKGLNILNRNPFRGSAR